MPVKAGQSTYQGMSADPLADNQTSDIPAAPLYVNLRVETGSTREASDSSTSSSTSSPNIASSSAAQSSTTDEPDASTAAKKRDEVLSNILIGKNKHPSEAEWNSLTEDQKNIALSYLGHDHGLPYLDDDDDDPEKKGMGLFLPLGVNQLADDGLDFLGMRHVRGFLERGLRVMYGAVRGVLRLASSEVKRFTAGKAETKALQELKEGEAAVAEARAAREAENLSQVERAETALKEGRKVEEVAGDVGRSAREASTLQKLGQAERNLVELSQGAKVAEEAAAMTKVSRLGELAKGGGPVTFVLSLVALPAIGAWFVHHYAPEGQDAALTRKEALATGKFLLVGDEVQKLWNDGHKMDAAIKFTGIPDAWAFIKAAVKDPAKAWAETKKTFHVIKDFGSLMYNNPEAARKALVAIGKATQDKAITGAVREYLVDPANAEQATLKAAAAAFNNDEVAKPAQEAFKTFTDPTQPKEAPAPVTNGVIKLSQNDFRVLPSNGSGGDVGSAFDMPSGPRPSSRKNNHRDLQTLNGGSEVAANETEAPEPVRSYLHGTYAPVPASDLRAA